MGSILQSRPRIPEKPLPLCLRRGDSQLLLGLFRGKPDERLEPQTLEEGEVELCRLTLWCIREQEGICGSAGVYLPP